MWNYNQSSVIDGDIYEMSLFYNKCSKSQYPMQAA